MTTTGLSEYERWLAEDNALPTFRHALPGDTSRGEEASELAASVGLNLDPWQRTVVSDWLTTEPDGTYTHPTGVLIVPRQSGKSFAVAARILYALYLGDDSEREIVYAAHRMQSTMEIFRLLVETVESNPTLAKRTKRIYTAAGGQSIVTHRGARLRVMSRVSSMGTGTRGSSLDLVVLDEALILTELYLSGLLPTMSARPNPQVLYISSSGDAESLILDRLRQSGYTRPPGFTLTEWAADPAMPGYRHDDERMWKRVNPGYPRRLTLDAMRSELATLSKASFERERAGIFSANAPDPALDYDRWAKVLVSDAGFPPRGGGTMVLDISITDGERFAALAVAWPTTDPISGREITRAVLVHAAAGTEWVPAKAAEVANRFVLDSVHFSQGSATDVTDTLNPVLPVTLVPFGKLKTCAQWLTEQLAQPEATIQIQSSPLLNETARVTHRRKSGEGWMFSSHIKPASPLNAVSLALMLSATKPVVVPAIW